MHREALKPRNLAFAGRHVNHDTGSSLEPFFFEVSRRPRPTSLRSADIFTSSLVIKNVNLAIGLINIFSGPCSEILPLRSDTAAAIGRPGLALGHRVIEMGFGQLSRQCCVGDLLESSDVAFSASF